MGFGGMGVWMGGVWEKRGLGGSCGVDDAYIFVQLEASPRWSSRCSLRYGVLILAYSLRAS